MFLFRCMKGNWVLFLNCYLGAPRPTLGHYWGGSLNHQMLITCILHIRPEGHREPHSKVGSLCLAKHLVRFGLGTFRFWSQCLNPLGHSPHWVFHLWLSNTWVAPNTSPWVLHLTLFITFYFSFYSFVQYK